MMFYNRIVTTCIIFCATIILSCNNKTKNVPLLKQEVVFTITNFLENDHANLLVKSGSIDAELKKYLDRIGANSNVRSDIINQWEWIIIENKIVFSGENDSIYKGIVITKIDNVTTTNYKGF